MPDSFLLQEDDSYILQEDGVGRIILERIDFAGGMRPAAPLPVRRVPARSLRVPIATRRVALTSVIA